MLVNNNKYDKDTVVTFKLVNGDEIVAKIVEDLDSIYKVSKPCTVMPSQKGIGLIQSLFTSNLDELINLDKKHVMIHSKTAKEVENYYIQTTTGIQPAGAGGIIT